MRPVLYLAPLHGVTNSIFRASLFKHFSGIDVVMAPFVNSVTTDKISQKNSGNHFKDLLPEYNKNITLIPQVLGNASGGFIETAKIIAGLGYTEINWNLGCPFPMVTNKKRGSGLLPHPQMIERFLEETVPALKTQLSVKVRLGLQNPSELLALMPIFNSFPLKKIIIHPRLGIQMYEGKVDLEGFEQAAKMSAHPIMYNGDIKNTSVFESLQERFPFVNEWMIGRWGIYNPFLFSILKKTEQNDNPISVIRSFHDDLFQRYREALSGPRHLLDKMKEIWTYLGKSFTGADRLLRDIKQAKTADAYQKTVDAIFQDTVWHGMPN